MKKQIYSSNKSTTMKKHEKYNSKTVQIRYIDCLWTIGDSPIVFSLN